MCDGVAVTALPGRGEGVMLWTLTDQGERVLVRGSVGLADASTEHGREVVRNAEAVTSLAHTAESLGVPFALVLSGMTERSPSQSDPPVAAVAQDLASPFARDLLSGGAVSGGDFAQWDHRARGIRPASSGGTRAVRR